MGKINVNELVTLAEAARILKVHPNTLRKWDQRGFLKAVRLGQRGDRKYRRIDLDSFILTSLRKKN